MVKWKYFEEAEFIWHGSWNDPELEYNGKIYNVHSIQDAMWDRFNEYAIDEDIEPSEENFTTYCLSNQEDIKELFELLEEEVDAE